MDDKKKDLKDGVASDKGSKKATKAETNNRIKKIISLQLEGYSRSDLLEFSSTNWGLERAQTDNLIKEATERLKEINQATIQDNIAIITANYWEQFRLAKANNNGQLCVTILKELSRIKGLDQTTVNHIIEDKRELETMTDAELDTLLEQGTNERH